ncbi:unnamed protein product [Symbiodinium sp. CCMP2456]|nr:unnamed protein product [Symbiodinium sp. CCMP2456]
MCLWFQCFGEEEQTPQETTEKLKPEEEMGVVRGASKWKKGRPLFEHGNYSSYYGYRHAPGQRGDSDRRLLDLTERFGKSFFKKKEVLDIGCNAGLVSLAVAREFQARRVVGMDLDADLIEAAEANYSCEMDKLKGMVEFRREDILSCPLRRGEEAKPERFDVVLCLSVTKWVHFAHGDTGIHNLFKRCFKRTRPGGYFVLEPQGWGSYKKKRHITRAIRDTVASIEIRPEAFAEYLVGLGFEKVDVIDPPDDLPKNFQRQLLIFRRPEEEAADDSAEQSHKRKAVQISS